MSQNPASAQIIAFPGHSKSTALQPTIATETPTERLQRALALLAEAQQEQKAALARWRGAIGELQTSMRGLGVSLRNYEGQLSRISPPHAP